MRLTGKINPHPPPLSPARFPFLRLVVVCHPTLVATPAPAAEARATGARMFLPASSNIRCIHSRLCVRARQLVNHLYLSYMRLHVHGDTWVSTCTYCTYASSEDVQVEQSAYQPAWNLVTTCTSLSNEHWLVNTMDTSRKDLQTRSHEYARTHPPTPTHSTRSISACVAHVPCAGRALC